MEPSELSFCFPSEACQACGRCRSGACSSLFCPGKNRQCETRSWAEYCSNCTSHPDLVKGSALPPSTAPTSFASFWVGEVERGREQRSRLVRQCLFAKCTSSMSELQDSPPVFSAVSQGFSESVGLRPGQSEFCGVNSSTSVSTSCPMFLAPCTPHAMLRSAS